MPHTIVASVAAAQAIVGATRPPDNVLMVRANGLNQPARYIYSATSTATDNAGGQLVIVPSGSVGRFLRNDMAFDLVLPVTFATADNALLATVPAELTLLPVYAGPMLETSTAWSGGVASTIGLSYTNGSTTRVKGSLAGGAAGNIGGTYVNFFQPTIGSGFATVGAVQAMVLYGGTTINHDRITSAFTAGAGQWHVPVFNLLTAIVPVTPP